jgi:AcrR family transcriptional regulator
MAPADLSGRIDDNDCCDHGHRTKGVFVDVTINSYQHRKGNPMGREQSETRSHILDVSARIIGERSSRELRVAEVAREANVGIPTIYYHFKSRTQLIAEAQANIYIGLLGPLHVCLTLAESAVAAKDEATFWAAVGENLVLAWRAGRPEDDWGILKLLLDVWSDPSTQQEFSTRLEVQFDRWITTAERAKELGWIDEGVDAKALIVSIWSASIGQAIFSSSSHLNRSPESIRDFFLHCMGAKVSGDSRQG